MTLPENVVVGQAGHVDDHREIAELLNGASATYPARSLGGTVTPAARLPFIDPRDFGAKFNLRSFTSAQMTSGSAVLAVPRADAANPTTGYVFTAADIGKRVKVIGAGVAGANLRTTITGVSGTSAVLAVAASTTVTAAGTIFGSDDTAAIQACWDYAAGTDQTLPGVTNPGTANTRLVVMPTGAALFTQLVVPRRLKVLGSGWGGLGFVYGIGFEFANNSFLYQAWDTNKDAIVFTDGSGGAGFFGPVEVESIQIHGDPDNTTGHGWTAKTVAGTPLAVQDGARLRNLAAHGFAGDGFHFPTGGVPGVIENCLAYSNTGAGLFFTTRGSSGGVLHLPMFSGDRNGGGLVHLKGQVGGQGTYNIRTLKSECTTNTYRAGGRQEYAVVLEDMGGTTVTLDGCEHITGSPNETVVAEGVIKITGTSVPTLTWNGCYARIHPGQTSGATLYAGEATTPVLVNDTVNSRTVARTESRGAYGPLGFDSPRDQPLYIPATAFDVNAGTPVRAAVGGGRRIAYLFDAAATETVVTSFQAPAGWNSARIFVLCANAGAGAGAVLWLALLEDFVSGETLNVADGITRQATAGAGVVGAQDALTIHHLNQVSPTIPLVPGRFMALRISRSAADASDTLPNDAALLGVRLERAS